MNTVPIMTTDRLLLREPVLTDWPCFADLMTSDRARHMGGPYSIEQAWGDFCHGIALWRLFGVGNLSIALQETGACIGRIEINQGPRYPEPELGWQLQAAAEGKGVMLSRRPSRCATGPFATASWRRSSATSARRTPVPSASPNVWAPSSIRRHGRRTPAIWCIDTLPMVP